MDEKKHIKIYSTKECGFCKAEKEFLREHKIEFEEVDVGENKEAAKEMIEKSNQMGVPVTIIDKEIIVGFDKDKISKLLNISS